MVKECKILKANECLTVVRFGEKDIQLPPIEASASSIFVAYEKGKYFVVNSEYKDASEQAMRRSKKATIKNVEEPIESEVLQDE